MIKLKARGFMLRAFYSALGGTRLQYGKVLLFLLHFCCAAWYMM